MNKWQCDEDGCDATALGEGGAIGLTAIGWSFTPRRLGDQRKALLCPRHRPDPIPCTQDRPDPKDGRDDGANTTTLGKPCPTGTAAPAMKAHPLPLPSTTDCLCADGYPAQYAVDFGGGRLFEICGECFAAIFGKSPTEGLRHLSYRSTTAEARDAFRAWMEHLGACEAARRLGGSFT